MKKLCIFLAVLLFAQYSQAQSISTEGKTFWVGFMDIFANQGGLFQKLFISSKYSTTVTVKTPNAALGAPWATLAWSTTVNVTPGTVSVVTLPTSTFASTSENVLNKGVFVTATQDISVYAVHQNVARTEASVVLPTSAFGGSTEYVVTSYPATGATGSGAVNSRSEFLIVAMKDDTDIRITPKAKTRFDKPAGVPFDIQLDSGQVYLVQSKLGTEGVDTDMTGSTIVGLNGCKPFGVFSGATAVYLPDASCGTWQHLYEQNYPTKTWGKEYLITPFAGMPNGFVYKVLASENNTQVTINSSGTGVTNVTLGKGEAHAVNVPNATTTVFISADKPINVSQFMKGSNCNGTAGLADPTLLVLNPLNQTIKKVTFSTVPTSGQENMNKHYVNIVVKTADKDKIKLQGNFIASDNFQPIPTLPTYSYASIDLVPYIADATSGAAVSLESEISFIAYAYGYGSPSAYAYSAGASFENQRYNFTISPEVICKTNPLTPVTFSGFGSEVTSYTWDFGDGTPPVLYTPPAVGGSSQVTHTYTNTGTYNVKMTVTVLDGCGSDYIVKQFEVLPIPAPTLGEDRNICTGTSTTLNAMNATLQVGSPTYKWYKNGEIMSGVTGSSVVVALAGTYRVEAVNKAGCSGFDEVMIGIQPVPTLNTGLTADKYCVNDAAIALTGTPAGGTFKINGQAATTFSPSVLGAGQYTVLYTYTDALGCIYTTNKAVTINALPTLSIDNLQPEYCIANAQIPLVGSPAGGTFTLNNQPQTYTSLPLDVLGAGTHTVKYTYQDANGCSNSTTKNVTINALPVLDLSALQASYCLDTAPFALTALPAGGGFTLNGNAQTMFDAKALGVGEHLLAYSFTDAKGCAQTQSKTIKVNALPTPVIDLRTVYCQGQGLVPLVATPAGGTFTLNGAPVTDFNTFAMALGEYEVIYTYQDANTCVNRDTAKFVLEPSPIVEITGLQFTYCINATPFNLTATPHPQNPNGFGIFRIDGGAPVTQVVPQTLGAGTHTVEYTYTDTRTNCVVSQTKNFQISGLPAVSLVSIGGLKPAYCLGDAPFSLTNLGSPAGGVFTVSGIVRTTFNPMEIGAGTHTVIYNFQDVNGCFNTASTEVLIYEKVDMLIPNLKHNYCSQNAAFELIGSPAGGTFYIDGVVSNTPHPLFSPATLSLGTHRIVYKNQTGCDSIVRQVGIFKAPEQVHYQNLEMCSFSGDTITLDAGEGATYLWSNARTTRVIKVVKSGNYTVTVRDTLGCVTTSEIFIQENCDPKFFIPTAFTPNGDGLNDVLGIFGQDFYKLELKIYNRWGELVFFSTRREEVWNGVVGGKPAPAGTYTVTVRYLERPNGIERSFTSFVNLIR